MSLAPPEHRVNHQDGPLSLEGLETLYELAPHLPPLDESAWHPVVPAETPQVSVADEGKPPAELPTEQDAALESKLAEQPGLPESTPRRRGLIARLGHLARQLQRRNDAVPSSSVPPLKLEDIYPENPEAWETPRPLSPPVIPQAELAAKKDAPAVDARVYGMPASALEEAFQDPPKVQHVKVKILTPGPRGDDGNDGYDPHQGAEQAYAAPKEQLPVRPDPLTDPIEGPLNGPTPIGDSVQIAVPWEMDRVLHV